ncbi:MAG: GHKL domain-containing protein, partial [Spirochaetales bacterium]|nr:GHKL domain-containing protein [Spirochaetales bacterium]
MIQENLLERTRRMATMGGLTSAMAHEIRQPLNLIKVLSDTLSYSLSLPEEKRYSPEVLQEKLADISRGVDRINDTIGNLRALFNISGRVEREPCDLNNVIGRTLSFYEQRLKANGINLSLELDSRIPLMTLSPIQIQEILTNLLNNAIDALEGFSPPSGEEKRMCIRTILTPSHVVLRCCDNGPGIPDDHIASLFDPYFSTKTEHDGMGMGLYLVKRMTEEMNGTIRVEKRPEPGAHFLLEFAL